MFFKLLLAFSVIPLVELYLIITIGGILGALPTIALVIVTAVAGASLARQQGMVTLLRVREKTDRGEMPGEEMVDALLIFIAGVVLLTPGFLTDAIGLLLLVPAIRRRFRIWLQGQLQSRLVIHHSHTSRYP